MLELKSIRHASVSPYPKLIFYKIGFDENSIAFGREKQKFKVRGKISGKTFIT